MEFNAIHSSIFYFSWNYHQKLVESVSCLFYLEMSYRGMRQSGILCIIIYVKAGSLLFLNIQNPGMSCHIRVIALTFERIILPSSAVSSSPRGSPYISFLKTWPVTHTVL